MCGDGCGQRSLGYAAQGYAAIVFVLSGVVSYQSEGKEGASVEMWVS